ncbi:hypothetical protein AMTR_s00048p00232090 [Amborella trichopoda]|uniref:Uncharacterized protein n=1 Tax=Amborella trichopoda TaxID=13333 RepID=U5CR81_AMBTC|nr:hypothetical protein AMTR_s00048p00232090 [Amborella trichopoda]
MPIDYSPLLTPRSPLRSKTIRPSASSCQSALAHTVRTFAPGPLHLAARVKCYQSSIMLCRPLVAYCLLPVTCHFLSYRTPPQLKSSLDSSLVITNYHGVILSIPPTCGA